MAVCAIVAWTARAVAAPEEAAPPRSRVAIVTSEGASEAVADAARRLRAEIEAQGFEVVSVVQRSGAAPLVEGAAPFSIITLGATSEGPSADVLLVVGDGPPVPLAINAADLGADASAGGLAIRVVERLRAGLFELAQNAARPRALPVDVAVWAGVTQQAPPPAVTPPPTTFAPPPATPPQTVPLAPLPDARGGRTERPAGEIWIGLSARSLLGYRGLRPALGPEAAVSVELPRRFAVGATVAGAFGVAPVEARAGSATTRHLLALANATRSFDVGSDIFTPRLGIAAGVHVLFAEGEADPGEGIGRSATSAAFAAGLGGGADIYATDGVRFVADASVLFVVPEPIVRIVREDAARGGYPTFSLSIGAQVSP